VKRAISCRRRCCQSISLPEVLKAYVEGQVASGDWGTPSEYVRELIRQDKERRMANLETELLAAARGPKIEVSIAEIRKKGLIMALRERVRTR
jgi:antitoxin ParD1/3/4